MNSESSSNVVRVRFAPSPTGYLHVGGARTALYNYLFAKKNNGKFILRIEDTDEARSSEESLRGVVDDLVWLGLQWDEGVDPVTLKDMGPYAPYRQSERQNLYQEIAQQFLKEGKAYYCFMSEAEIELQREKAKTEGKSHHVESPYADWSLEKALEKKQKGESAVVRFKTKHLKRDYLLQDLVRGEVRFPSDMVGDFVLLRSDGMPVYNFCCAVDDYMMKITHVLRAEEHLPNTLRQLMIYEAMGWKTPQFGHVSLILDDDRQKLSKRKGAVSCGQFKTEGYLPSALLNFIALLGWSHPDEKEILTLAEMIEGFDTNRLNPSGAVFDRVKLKWMNSMHLRALPHRELWNLLIPFFEREKFQLPADLNWQELSLETFKPRMEILSDAIELYRPLNESSFFVSPESEETLKLDSTPTVLKAWIQCLRETGKEVLSESEFLEIQEKVKNLSGAKGKNLFTPIRVAVIGKPQGTEVKLLIPLLRVQTLIERGEKVLSQMSTM